MRLGYHVGWKGQGSPLGGGMAKSMTPESQLEVASVAAVKHPSTPAIFPVPHVNRYWVRGGQRVMAPKVVLIPGTCDYVR